MRTPEQIKAEIETIQSAIDYSNAFDLPEKAQRHRYTRLETLQWVLTDSPQIEYAVSCTHPRYDTGEPDLRFGIFTDLAQAQKRAKELHGRVFQRTINSWEPATNPTKDA